MKTLCDKIQERLAQEGNDFLKREEHLRIHCTECDDCFAVLEGMQQLESVFVEAEEYDVSDEVVEKLLQTVQNMPVSRTETSQTSSKSLWQKSLAGVQTLLQARPWQGVPEFKLSDVLRSISNAQRQRILPRLEAALAGALALTLVFVLHKGNYSRLQSRSNYMDANAKRAGAKPASSEQYSDLIQSFKSDIDRAKQDQSSVEKSIQQNQKELKEHKERVTGIFETLVDKFANLQRETDSLAAALKQQQESPVLDQAMQAKNLEGPDELESLGFDTPNAPAPPPASPSFRDFDEGGDLVSDKTTDLSASTQKKESASNSKIWIYKDSSDGPGAANEQQPQKQVASAEQPENQAINGGDREEAIDPQSIYYRAPVEPVVTESDIVEVPADVPFFEQIQAKSLNAENSAGEAKPLRASVIAPGDSASVTLLTGVNAPVDGTPYPVIFKLNGPITGPDGQTIDLGEAKIIASAQGSESDSRALFRLSKIIIRQADGRRQILPIDGWVVGKDGMRGTPGKVVDKLGRFIAPTTSIEISAGLSQEAESVKESQGIVTASKSTELTQQSLQLSQMLQSRANSLVPVVEVNSGQEVDVIFSQPADLSNLKKASGKIEDGKQSGPAQTFFSRIRSTAGLKFQQASGYWANSYLPGDPTIRKLHSVLLKKDRSILSGSSGQPLRLHDASRQMEQPFDAPKDAALGLFVNSDQAVVNGPSRLLVQVGLKGATQSGGRRPAMNLNVVLDLRGVVLSPAGRELIQQFLFELNKAKDIGDRFSLSVTGRSKTTLLTPETFTHGQLAVAIKEIFDEPEVREGRTSLQAVMRSVIDRVKAADDSQSPLGATSILLIEPKDISSELSELESVVHKSAVAGVPVSVIGAGPAANQIELDRLALAGQGNRRILRSSADAVEAVQKEINSVSTTVARAVRLNIRLAPGVKLVDVLGSYKLNAQQIRRTREAEVSIDNRIAKNLGITADRGKDEDGIQIVIPAYHAGDDHVILLDVVADVAGPIAEVSAKFKDIVHLRNGSIQANLNIPQSGMKEGMLERNVIKNRLAFELYSILEQAASAMRQREDEKARTLLSEQRTLLLDLSSVYPDFSRDSEIQADISMLGEYLELLKVPPQSEEARSYLESSLEYAGKIKLTPRPAES